MSTQTENPFATPKSDVSRSNQGNDTGNAITIGIVEQLKKTRPWVLLISILGFIFTALMAIGTLGIFFGGGAAIFSGSPGMQGMGPGAMIMGMGFMYLLMTILYFFISLKLYKFADGIKKFIATGTSQDMEFALKQQASFWKIVGILTLITLIITVVFLLFGVGAALIGITA